MVETFLGVVAAAVAAFFVARTETRHFLTWWHTTLSGELPSVVEHLEAGARSWAKGEGGVYHSILESPNIEAYLVGRSWLVPRVVFRALVKANHMRIAMEHFQNYAHNTIASAQDQGRAQPFFDRVSEAYGMAAERARRALSALDTVRGAFFLRAPPGGRE